MSLQLGFIFIVAAAATTAGVCAERGLMSDGTPG